MSSDDRQPSSKMSSGVLLDDEGHEVPTFQALHINTCVPTAKDRRYLDLRGVAGVHNGEEGGVLSLAGRTSFFSSGDRAQSSAQLTGDTSRPDSGSLKGTDSTPILRVSTKPLCIDESVLRVVECVQVTMRFTVTKDKKFPANYVIHSGQGSLKYVYDHLEEEFRDHPDTHDDFKPTEEMRNELERILLENDCLTPPTEREKVLLWCCREECSHHPQLLPKFLQSVDWTNPDDVKEVHRMLFIWRLGPPIEALELLDILYSDTMVREYAVYRLSVPRMTSFLLSRCS